MPTAKQSGLAGAVERMKLPTTPEAYKTARAARGSQVEVADALGINRVTIAKRETGADGYPITREAALALLALPTKGEK